MENNFNYERNQEAAIYQDYFSWNRFELSRLIIKKNRLQHIFRNMITLYLLFSIFFHASIAKYFPYHDLNILQTITLVCSAIFSVLCVVLSFLSLFDSNSARYKMLIEFWITLTITSIAILFIFTKKSIENSNQLIHTRNSAKFSLNTDSERRTQNRYKENSGNYHKKIKVKHIIEHSDKIGIMVLIVNSLVLVVISKLYAINKKIEELSHLSINIELPQINSK